MNSVLSSLKGVREYLTPILTESQFLRKGVLSPEEFVAAGDQLVFRCPTWTWESGESNQRRSYLPDDKQFLSTRNVPCLSRISDYGHVPNEQIVEEDDEGGWVSTHKAVKSSELIQDIEALRLSDEVKKEEVKEVEDEHIPDISELDDENDQADLDNAIADDDFVATHEPNQNVIATRTYDISITYDKYYRTPRVWLFGYDENRNPLSSDAIMEDISGDHAGKTVTIERHPHKAVSCLSIHPCQHSSVMKTLLDRLIDSGTEPRVDQYMFIFLKLMSGVLPTIEYDFTMDT